MSSSPPRSVSEGDSDDSSGIDPLFVYKPRGAFKKRKETDDSDDDALSLPNAAKRQQLGQDSDDDNDSDEFDSPCETRVVRDVLLNTIGGPSGSVRPSRLPMHGDTSDSSLRSDDDREPTVTCKPIVDEEEMRRRADMEADALMSSPLTLGISALDVDQHRRLEKSRRFSRTVREQLAAAAAASEVQSPTVPGQQFRNPLTPSVPSPSVNDATQIIFEYERRRRLAKSISLTVFRGTEKHKVHTKMNRTVAVIANLCQEHLLRRKEQDDGVRLKLLYKENELRETDTLLDAGLPVDAGGAVILRARVVADGKNIDAPASTESTLTLKVRVMDGKSTMKTFQVALNALTQFSWFMECFRAAMGITPDLTSAITFTVDGDALDPSGTPQGEDLEDDDLIDVKVSEDLVPIIATAPDKVNIPPQAATAPQSPADASVDTPLVEVVSARASGRSQPPENPPRVATRAARRQSAPRPPPDDNRVIVID